jgi:hypothetical protein
MRKMTSSKKTHCSQRVLLTFGFFLFLILFYPEPAHADGGGHAYVEPSVPLIDQRIKVSPATYTTFTLDRLTPGARVGIKINVTGGTNNDIFAYLLDTENHARFMRKEKFLTYIKDSKVVYQNSFEIRLPQSGPYYLVLDNSNSILSSKNVQVYLMSVLNQPLAQHITLKKGLEEFYGILEEMFDFPGFNMTVRHCGEENAFSSPDITICFELMEGAYKRGNATSIAWTIFHELGHTLLRLWDYPLWDNEDAADEFATVLVLMGNNSDGRLALRQAVSEWLSRPSDREAKVILERGDRHSISIQRARNILQWEQNADELKRRWFKIFVNHIKTHHLQQLKIKPEPWMDLYLIENELKKR